MKILSLASAVGLVLFCFSDPAVAEKVCIRSTLARGKASLTRRVVPSSSKCARGFLEVVDTATLTGPQGQVGVAGIQGPPGPQGTNGKLQIYGDGSAGDLVVSTNTNWLLSAPPDNNYQFVNCTINAGVTLTLPSGGILRCLQGFTNNGTILVSTAARGANTSAFSGTAGSISMLDLAAAPPSKGPLALGLPMSGARGDSSEGRIGGVFTLGYFNAGTVLGSGAGIQRLYWGIEGGSGGGAASVAGSFGGAGGGTLSILALGAILNSGTGTIAADGASGGSGGGGGGGGIITLASPTSITNSGSISAAGGNGGSALDSSSAARANGGGGGGGLVHFVSRSVVQGTVDVSGGSGGSAAVTLSSTIRSGGGSGGASAGTSGSGASVPAGTVTSSSASSGSAGKVLETHVDPSTLG